MPPQPPPCSQSRGWISPAHPSLPSQACVTSQSQFLPCQWVLEHSSQHLPQADEFKTCAERKEIWGMEQMQTASSCYKTNVAPLKPPTNPTLGGLFICSVDKGRAQWKKSQQSHFRNSHSGEGFSFSRSANVTEDLKDSFQEMKRFSSVRWEPPNLLAAHHF